MQSTGAELLIRLLRKEGVDTIFAYPGGQVIDIFDALYGQEQIRLVLPRHEQGLVHAADGYARSTGRVGVCLVTSGPGAANLVTGIATANADSVPLVCFAGQVPTRLIGSNAFQEVDFISITKSICKYGISVRSRAQLAEAVPIAFEIARSGRPGVAVVELPKDIQQARGKDLHPGREPVPIRRQVPAVHTGQLAQAMERLHKAARPLFLAGGGVRIARAEGQMTRLAEKTGIPVVTTLMGKGAIPSAHPLSAGNLGIHGSFAANTAVSQCDVLFAVGTRFNDRITGKPEEFAKHTYLIRADIDTSALPCNITADLSIEGDARQILEALLAKAAPVQAGEWRQQLRRWKQTYPTAMQQEGLTPQRVMEAVNQAFPAAVICADVGQNQMWAAQFLDLNEERQLLTSGGLGTMGYALPAAVGASLGCPSRRVVVITGDGGMQMNVQELATAVAYELPVVVCILNNGWLGNVRQWQELFYGRRYVGVCMRRRKGCPPICAAPGTQCPPYTPDFVRLAESYGALGLRVSRFEELPAAFLQAKQNKAAPTVIEFVIAPTCNVMPIVPPGNPLNQMLLHENN